MDKRNDLVDTFKWLGIGLLICFATAYFVSTNVDLVFNVVGGGGWIIFMIAEIVLAIILSALIKKISPIVAKILYIVYTALTGVTLSSIFLVYELTSIEFVFLITACIFGVFAIIGKFSKIDLSKWSVYLFIALIGIIICSIINLFIRSEAFDLTLCVISIVVFCLYIAVDINRLLKSSFLDDSENKGIFYAFQLFLDVINLFIRLLEIFGKARD